jgi:hypothetical protein
MSDLFAARENLVMALDDVADFLAQHGQQRWAVFVRGVIDHPEDERALDRLRGSFGALTDLVLDPEDADADFLYQQRLGHAWVNLERLARTD